jgi:hypothetical protein
MGGDSGSLPALPPLGRQGTDAPLRVPGDAGGPMKLAAATGPTGAFQRSRGKRLKSLAFHAFQTAKVLRTVAVLT